MSRKEQLTEIQRMLIALHYYRGKPDGILGNDTRAAIRKVQASAGMPQTGEPSQELIEVLRDLVGPASKK
jgi:peptidoglycan hydrolase-like protein with peptidoglycan-binding domain